MDFRSYSFLGVTVSLFAIAAFALSQGMIPFAVMFAVFGTGGLLVRHTAKK